MEKEESSKSFKKPHLKIRTIFFFSRTINIISAAVLFVTTGVQCFIVKIPIGKTALFYFFSSIAQSMAAILALAGTFAIFKYSLLNNRKEENERGLRQLLGRGDICNPAKLARDWITYWNADQLKFNAISASKCGYLDSAAQEEIKRALDAFNISEKYFNNFVAQFKPVFISSCATFVLSAALIPFSGGIAGLALGVFFWEFFTFLIVITSFNLYYYFVGTATLGKDA